MQANAEYLTKRSDSKNWQLQLIVPDDVRKLFPQMPAKYVQSMRTRDHAEAKQRAQPIIDEFRDLISQAKWQLYGEASLPKIVLLRKQEPGTTISNPDGTISVATNDAITVMVPVPPYNVVRTEPNTITGAVDRFTIPHLDGGTMTINREFSLARTITKSRDKPPVKYDLDAAALDVWANEGDAKNQRYIKEAKATLNLFHATTGKTFASAVWEDGRALDTALTVLGNKSATRKKKIGWLGYAFKLAKRQTRTFPQLQGRDNPFSGVVNLTNDALRKEDFTDDHTDLFRERMHELGGRTIGATKPPARLEPWAPRGQISGHCSAHVCANPLY